MAVLNQALAARAQPDAYSALIEELRKLQGQADAPMAPMYTPEEQRARVRQNNDAMMLGLAGTMSPDQTIRATNGRVLTRALADRDEKETAQGIFDPLTGQMRESPEYQRKRAEERRGKVLEQALRFEDQRQRAAERAAAVEQRAADQAAQAEANRQLRRDLAANRAGTDAEMLDLRKNLVRAQTDAARSTADTRALKLDQQREKVTMQQDAAIEKADTIMKNIDTALTQAGKTTTGVLGAAIGKIPGTTAYNMRRTIDTVKANIGFQELNAMRQMSPTGGALGQVAVKELDFLQATLGSLDANQGEQQLRANLAAVRQHYANWKNAVIKARNEAEVSAGGGSSAGAGRGVTGAPGAAAADTPPPGVDARTWRHMTPEEKALFR